MRINDGPSVNTEKYIRIQFIGQFGNGFFNEEFLFSRHDNGVSVAGLKEEYFFNKKVPAF